MAKFDVGNVDRHFTAKNCGQFGDLIPQTREFKISEMAVDATCDSVVEELV